MKIIRIEGKCKKARGKGFFEFLIDDISNFNGGCLIVLPSYDYAVYLDVFLNHLGVKNKEILSENVKFVGSEHLFFASSLHKAKFDLVGFLEIDNFHFSFAKNKDDFKRNALNFLKNKDSGTFIYSSFETEL